MDVNLEIHKMEVNLYDVKQRMNIVAYCLSQCPNDVLQSQYDDAKNEIKLMEAQIDYLKLRQKMLELI